MQILGISGSLDASSSNRALLRMVERAATSANVSLFESTDELPHFSPDRDDPAPDAVQRLRAAVQAADAVLIATPEYAGGIPGSLKNALDWLVSSGELYGKDAVIVSAAPSLERGVHARESLALTLRMQGARVCDSFTVAVARGDPGAVASGAAEVLARVQRAVVDRECTGNDAASAAGYI